MVGPWLPDPNAPGKKRRAHLFCFLDDHSRLVPYAEFFFDEALPRLERVLKVGILRRGLPKAMYVDNGKVYAAHQFEAACASLGIRKLHTAPYSPEVEGQTGTLFLHRPAAVHAGGGNLRDCHPDRTERVLLGLAGTDLPPHSPLRNRANPARTLPGWA